MAIRHGCDTKLLNRHGDNFSPILGRWRPYRTSFRTLVSIVISGSSFDAKHFSRLLAFCIAASLLESVLRPASSGAKH
jgi:hypothetical protein